MMDYQDDSRRAIPRVGAPPPPRRTRRKAEEIPRSVLLRTPATNNVNQLMLRRAVDRFNRREPLPDPHLRLDVAVDGDTFSLRLLRKQDGALIHQSRAMHLSCVAFSNVNTMIRKFLKQESLKEFEHP